MEYWASRTSFDEKFAQEEAHLWIVGRLRQSLRPAGTFWHRINPLEERCELAFEMYDIDRSGYLSIDEIEAMMMSTNLTTRDLIRKRAENFMMCADLDRSGGITIDELIVAAEKLPNLLYPPQTNSKW